MSRPVCKACNQRYVAINYRKEDVVHYRTRCDTCIRRNRNKKPQTARWKQQGYKKKLVCDRCRFRAKYSSQMLVYHIDGNLNNCNLNNLKTICMNCSIEVMKSDSPWKVGDLNED